MPSFVYIFEKFWRLKKTIYAILIKRLLKQVSAAFILTKYILDLE